jgi:hypothetical protein
MTRISLLFVGALLCFYLHPVRAEEKPIPLGVAVKTGLVEVEVQGRGSCSGDAVRVDVRRKVDRPIQVVVESGTVLESAAGDVQGMVCHGVKYERVGNKYRRVDVMNLNDNKKRCFLLESYCRDFAKATPRVGSSFRLGEKEKAAAQVIVKGKAAGASVKAVQAAVWIHAGVTDEQLRGNFNASEAEIKVAHGLVAAAKAAQRNDRQAEATADASVTALVDDLLKTLLARRDELPYVRGDTVEVTAGDAPIQVGRRTIGTAKKGEHFMVLAVDRDGVRVMFTPDENRPPRRGWISFDHIQLAAGVERGGGRPVLRKLGEWVSEEQLEVITAVDRGR